MIYPDPLPGLVIRYSFFWSREAKAGATEGRKDRPCAIVVATLRGEQGTIRVVVARVTHPAPNSPQTAVELPRTVTTALGLDPEPSWVSVDELNVFAWPGYDLRPVPGTNQVSYGALPQRLFEEIRRGIVALDRARKVRVVSRD